MKPSSNDIRTPKLNILLAKRVERDGSYFAEVKRNGISETISLKDWMEAFLGRSVNYTIEFTD